ncbi:MAG: hypothetical protein EXR98_16305 [Gemmataceae bacterium]|nr:hypothetical protein [Gemmataceae bacterium]
MSSAPVPPESAPSPAPPGDTGTRASDRIIVYRHSHLFYWWPVWGLGFIFALITLIDNQHLAIVPANTVAVEDQELEFDGKKQTRHVLVLDEGKKHRTHKAADDKDEITQPTIFITHYRSLGSVYVIVLLIVIVITNVSIRGLWSVFFIVTILMLTLIFWAAGWWDNIFIKLTQLSIFINMGGYLLISTVLFVLWLINFLLFDRQTYMIFAPGQVRVRTEIGGEETVYDTTGMVVQKARNDLFRHWILGFGSGDLVIKPVGLAHPIEFHNVLLITAKVIKIETMVKEKVIIRSPESRAANA